MSDTQMQDILQRLDRLESKDAIRELVSAYAVACDAHDMPLLTSLFAADACFDSPSGAMVANGRDEIVDMFERTFKTRGPGFHWTHDVTIAINPDYPDEARGLVFSHAETSPDGVVSMAAMRYEDEYRRTNGKWQFTRRCIKFLYYVPVTEFHNSLNTTDRVYIGGQRQPADVPEQLQPWQDFIDQFGPVGQP